MNRPEPDDAPIVITDAPRSYEDEFAAHAVRFAYPPELVARVRADAEALLEAVRRREPPFDGPTAARRIALVAPPAG